MFFIILPITILYYKLKTETEVKMKTNDQTRSQKSQTLIMKSKIEMSTKHPLRILGHHTLCEH